METGPEAGIELAVCSTDALGKRERTQLRALFREAYRNADEAYLERSLARLRFVATATSGGELAGFALGEKRLMDLPRLPQQVVALAGVCCVDSRFRRRGLFRALEQRAFAAAALAPAPRILACGRVAHPASFRTMTGNPTHVPKRGVRPSVWHREVGLAIAEAYGVTRFDPETFVCFGNGAPIGDAAVEIDVSPEEWEVFARVDRRRGDSLLGLIWTPDAPEGW